MSVCMPFTPFFTCFPLKAKMTFLPGGLLTEDRSELNCLLFLTKSEKVKNVLDCRAEKCLKMECYFKNLPGRKGTTPSLGFLVRGEKKKFSVTAVILDVQLY